MATLSLFRVPKSEWPARLLHNWHERGGHGLTLAYLAAVCECSAKTVVENLKGLHNNPTFSRKNPYDLHTLGLSKDVMLPRVVELYFCGGIYVDCFRLVHAVPPEVAKDPLRLNDALYMRSKRSWEGLVTNHTYAHKSVEESIKLTKEKIENYIKFSQKLVDEETPSREWVESPFDRDSHKWAPLKHEPAWYRKRGY